MENFNEENPIELLVAVMKNGQIQRCFECQKCWVLLGKENMKHNCCDDAEDDTLDVDQLHFVRNLKKVYQLA